MAGETAILGLEQFASVDEVYLGRILETIRAQAGEGGKAEALVHVAGREALVLAKFDDTGSRAVLMLDCKIPRQTLADLQRQGSVIM